MKAFAFFLQLLTDSGSKLLGHAVIVDLRSEGEFRRGQVEASD